MVEPADRLHPRPSNIFQLIQAVLLSLQRSSATETRLVDMKGVKSTGGRGATKQPQYVTVSWSIHQVGLHNLPGRDIPQNVLISNVHPKQDFKFDHFNPFYPSIFQISAIRPVYLRRPTYPTLIHAHLTGTKTQPLTNTCTTIK